MVAVVPESPADQVGIRRGDIIVGLDGSPVGGPRGLVRRLRDHDVGERIEIEILRDGEKQALSVELGARPRRWSLRLGDDDDPHSFHWNQEGFEEQMEQLRERLEGMQFEMPRIEGDFHFFAHKPKLGLQLVDATPELREHLGGSADAGVLVGKVMKGMPAEAAGIQVGDLIESVDGETIEDAGDLVRALEDKSGESITIGVIRDRRPLQIDVVLPDFDEEPAKGPRV